jgi:hypothetical protein
MIREVNLLISLKWLKFTLNSEWMLSGESTKSSDMTRGSHDIFIPITFPTLPSAPTVVRWRLGVWVESTVRGSCSMPQVTIKLQSAPTAVRWWLGVWVESAVRGIMFHAPGVHQTTVGADGSVRMTRGMGCISNGQSGVFTFDAPCAQHNTVGAG